jgi:5-methylcytosine-specific restriction protein A
MPPTFRPPGARSRREANQQYDRQRYANRKTRRLYSLKRWADIRDDQLRRERFCRMCRARGELTLATTCDHVEPHNDDEDKFWAGPFQSLCKDDHDRVKQAEEAAARRARPARIAGG